jgi:hypothetical protein
MSTFSCGSERPLLSNEQLYALDERTMAVGLAQFADSTLNRYSFVAQDHSATEADLLPLLTRMGPALGGGEMWLVAFPKASSASPIRSRALVARLTNREWKITEGADVYLATKPMTLGLEQSLAPSDVDLVIAGWAIIFGQSAADQSFVDEPFKETLRMLALTHRLQPSRQFLAACGSVQLAVAYLAKDARERLGIVVVTTRDLSACIQSMHSDGLIERVLSGPDANQVWRE